MALSDDESEPFAAKALREFPAIADVWSLSQEDRIYVLGAPDAATYREWIESALCDNPVELPETLLERLGGIVAMHYAGGPDAGAEIRAAVALGLFPERIKVFIEGLRKLSAKDRGEDSD